MKSRPRRSANEWPSTRTPVRLGCAALEVFTHATSRLLHRTSNTKPCWAHGRGMKRQATRDTAGSVALALAAPAHRASMAARLQTITLTMAAAVTHRQDASSRLLWPQPDVGCSASRIMDRRLRRRHEALEARDERAG